jgi:lipoprotein LprG
MQGLQSVHFAISRSGGPAYLDSQGTLIFSSAEGDYAAPDAIQAEITVAGPGIALAVNTVAIGDEQWVTNPLNQQWEKLPPGWGFNPAVLFDPQQGWQPLLNEDVSNVSLVGLVEQGEQPLYQMRATAASQRISTVTSGLAGGDEAITVEIWIDPATSLVHQLHFITGSPTGEPADWTLRFSQFNSPVTIAPPAVAS